MKILISIVVCALCAGVLNAATIHVPADQPTIQAGIDSAAIGDTVLVAAGIYYEQVTIDKSIHLVSYAVVSPVIDGMGIGDVVTVTADNVMISNFSIIHSGSYAGWEENWDAAIDFFSVDSCLVEHCKLYDNPGAGIAAAALEKSTFTACVFYNNEAGIYFYEDYNDMIRSNYSNNILNNVFQQNSTGIRFEHTIQWYHQSNVIRGNYLTGNGWGLSMIMSDANTVSYNRFESNSTGVSLSACMAGGENNRFHHNSFVGNNNQASDYGMGIDYWYSPSQGEGNYWSDYTGIDADFDGIGDTPYDIPGDDNSQDLYPLMQPAESLSLCVGIRGNIDSDPLQSIDISDLVYLVDYMFSGGPPPPSSDEADIDGSGILDIADLVYLVDYMFNQGPAPVGCP